MASYLVPGLAAGKEEGLVSGTLGGGWVGCCLVVEEGPGAWPLGTGMGRKG